MFKQSKILLLFSLLACNYLKVDASAAPGADWVDQQMARLSTRQKIAQMIMVAMNSSHQTTLASAALMVGDEEARKLQFLERKAAVMKMIAEEDIGGIICFRGDPRSQVELLTELQQLSLQSSGLPLLVSQDAEWGLAMRLSDVPRLPKNMTLGAIQNKELLRVFGKFVGYMCRVVGVHVNFAPVVDVNTNYKNPVIGTRALHDNPVEVGNNAWYIIAGMLEENVLPCAKHAPGHGDTSKDSHKDLPVITHDKERLNTVELHPFRKLIRDFGNRISIMIGHIAVPTLTQDANLPASLSDKMIKGVVRSELEFRGLVIPDALNMSAITKFYTPAQAALAAFMAGNDILLYVDDVEEAINLIETLVQQNKMYAAQLDASVRRILYVKRQIIEQNRVMPMDIERDMFAKDQRILDLKRTLFEEAITLVRDERGLLPIKNPQTKVGYLKIGGNKDSLDEVKKLRSSISTGYVNLDQGLPELEMILKTMADSDVIIVAIGRVHDQQSPYGNVPEISPVLQQFLNRIHLEAKPVVFSLLASPYALKFFQSESTCLEAYEDDVDAEIGTLKVIFGLKQAKGKLPINLVPVDVGSVVKVRRKL